MVPVRKLKINYLAVLSAIAAVQKLAPGGGLPPKKSVAVDRLLCFAAGVPERGDAAADKVGKKVLKRVKAYREQLAAIEGCSDRDEVRELERWVCTDICSTSSSRAGGSIYTNYIRCEAHPCRDGHLSSRPVFPALSARPHAGKLTITAGT